MTVHAVRPAAASASLADQMRYAEALAGSGLLPAQYRKQPANVLYAISYAEMLGLHPMSAVTGIHVIDGKPTASAALISALVRRAGHRLRVTGDDTHAVAEITRSDDPDFVFRAEWTLSRAKQAGLAGKKVWSQYPAAMLKARAITEAARDACEDALAGLHYTAEELGAEVDAEGNPTHEDLVRENFTSAPAERGPIPPEQDAWAQPFTDEEWLSGWTARLRKAQTEDALRPLWAEMRQAVTDCRVSEQDAATCRQRFDRQLTSIRGAAPDLTDSEQQALEHWSDEQAQADVAAAEVAS